MRSVFIVSFILANVHVSGQKNIEPTNAFVIEGRTKNKLSFTLKDLSVFKTKHLDSIVIYSHLMEPRKTMRDIKGVLLKDIIDKAVVDAELPKHLSEYYIICIASDNYKVVFSWNELFNSIQGESIMIITEADGQISTQLPDRIALLSAADRATGRRFVKGLQKVIIEK